eukprot:Phypoly_transcript_03341.p1 GENE.Phypoly_transcript_03341~~Phypoly_transcript_03341.p1  ORF type:complete len:676 (+),score=83.60 Phypoly_transcript_03341:431-2458(+)
MDHRSLCYVALFLCIISPSFSATTIYISPSGQAASGCTQSNPCGLQSGVFNANQNGDVVVLLDGTYFLTSSVPIGFGVSVTTLSGPSGVSVVCLPPNVAFVNINGNAEVGDFTAVNCSNVVGASMGTNTIKNINLIGSGITLHSDSTTITGCNFTGAENAVLLQTENGVVNFANNIVRDGQNGVLCTAGTCTVNITNSNFENLFGTAISGGVGSSAYLQGSALTQTAGSFVSVENAYLDDVTITNAGGAVSFSVSGNLQIRNSHIRGLVASQAPLPSHNTVLFNSIFENCVSQTQSILSLTGFVYGLTVDRCIFRKNSAPYGVIYATPSLAASPLLVTNSIFDGNVGHVYAGAINVQISATLTNNTFTNNNGSTGGAVSAQPGARITMLSCTFANNTAMVGGAIYAIQATTSVTNSSFNRNAASSYGGAIYVDSANSDGDAGLTTISGSQFMNNVAQVGGGIVVQEGAPVQFFDDTISGNVATRENMGDGIYIPNPFGTSSLTNVQVTNTVISNDSPAEFCCDNGMHIYTNVTNRVCNYPACRPNACPAVPTGSCLCPAAPDQCANCSAGWQGTYCDTDVDECALNATLCGNGTCVNTRGSYQCVCPPGQFGQDCEMNCDPLITCNGEGTCDANGKCVCEGNFTGPNCNQCKQGFAGADCNEICILCNFLICLCL